ncbi:RNA editing associated helicase 2,putative;with=GeneDB:Tb927.4.1500 [Leishmania infantum JPCM5]|uniref:RNA helicase n=2 Tax=Leishmania infantum TaxID=5671 RepID=A4IA90_LEIIN|nr:RNA editing associated helicase 2,putative;with=GeneDB:Tb927.4.1500 [Leishmania infantum JPCM5]CAM71746.1 RNA editing associated helicase 2,putative;with=GeneDB:Tb927.4.1500 [Leishmania infantum JPCM5]|eukprot:XP_001468659.1 RNA editing associated helicase 2,putative;with=GeneDB:Tb927.4.1500 [Leishmania infantum JPCM5]
MFYPLYPSPPAFSLMLTLTFSSLHDLPLMCVPVRLCLRASMFFFLFGRVAVCLSCSPTSVLPSGLGPCLGTGGKWKRANRRDEAYCGGIIAARNGALICVSRSSMRCAGRARAALASSAAASAAVERDLEYVARTLPAAVRPSCAVRARLPLLLLSWKSVLGSVCSSVGTCMGPLHSSLRHFRSCTSAPEIIEPEEINLIDAQETWACSAEADASKAEESSSKSASTSTLAWSAANSPALPSVFADVKVVDPYARARMLGFVRRNLTAAAQAPDDSSDVASPATAGFQTEAVCGGELFHARLQLPVTRTARQLVEEISAAGGSGAPRALWAHGVANTAKEAELLAAMHAEQMADLLGYHVFSLPSKQHRHAEAARAAGRYASSPEDKDSGPSTEQRLAQWPLPLRRVLTDEETEGGEWQLVNTASSLRHYISTEHTLLSPCLLDPKSRFRIEALFARAPHGCPSFAQQLRTEKVRTLTASSAAGGGEEAIVARLVLPSQVTGITNSSIDLVASGKAMERSTAVLLACMHAELLLDAVGVSIFDDVVTQKAHAMAAWSHGRPAPLPGAKPKNPSHVHLPQPLKELVVAAAGEGRSRTSSRSAEEDWFHRHTIVTEQSGSFVETVVGESTAVEDITAFLHTHGAMRAAAPFLQVAIGSRVKSTVLLPLPDLYGIRGGVGIASNAHDADTLAAMHALDVLCMLGVPVKAAAAMDAAWKRARRERIPDVPCESADVSTPSPPARRCTAKKLTTQVAIAAVALPEVFESADAAQASSCNNASTSTLPRRRAVKRARLASDASAPDESIPQANANGTAAASPPSVPVVATSRETEEKRLAAVRAVVPKEFWDMQADSPDGYIMIAPGVPEGSAMAAYAITSPRKMDKSAKGRVLDYLATVGRRLDDVTVVRQALSEEETEGPPRHRCALKVPVPAVCGEARLALGEADTIADAENAACMHAELILDTLGVCLYTDPVKQKRHAAACAQWGRWAPSTPGEEQPSSTPSPPPLRREHAGSLHRERQKEPTRKRGSRLGTSQRAAKTDASTAEMAEQAALVVDAEAFDDVVESQLDTVSKNRVQYYLRYENLKAPSITFTTNMGHSVLLHVATWSLPVPARFGSETESQKCLEYAVKGAASTRRDAELLSWMHAERTLDYLGIPLFPNLPKLQAYHAQRAQLEGRVAPAVVTGPTAPLPHPSEVPVKPLRLHISFCRVDLTIPPPPCPSTDMEGNSCVPPHVWEAYVEACAVYVLAKQMALKNSYYEEQRVPPTGDVVIDAALAEAEAKPVDTDARLRFAAYCMTTLGKFVPRYDAYVVGPIHHRLTYATVPLPGFDYLLGRGVGPNKVVAKRRAAMHALAILRRVDESYDDTFQVVKSFVQRANAANKVKGDAQAHADDEFDLDTFSTLPLINADAESSLTRQERRHLDRFSSLFVTQSAWYSKSSCFTLDGKKRAVRMYTVCFDLPAPEERQLVRLLPRGESESTWRRQPSADTVKLEVESVEATAPDATRVKTGAIFSACVSIVDEGGQKLTASCSGGGRVDNMLSAYEKLFTMMDGKFPAMKLIMELLKQNPYLMPELIPSLAIPDAVRQRMQACLRNQKDLTAAMTCSDGKASSASHKPNLAGSDKEKTGGEAENSSAVAHQSSYNDAEESARLVEQLQRRITNPVYLEKFATRRAELSIAEHKHEILEAIRSNPITIICGTTGCGKTTQVPQYILDEETLRGNGGRCSIIVTQPRRLSAVSIAQRVAAERLEPLEESTGYMIRFDSRKGRHITFATTGLVLRLMQSDALLSSYTHVIIDEIHERDMNSDFILMLLRQVLEKRRDIRIVLMSATLQAGDFQAYFGGAPLIQVEGHIFPVKEFFLEDLVPFAREHNCLTPLLKEAAGVAGSGGKREGDASTQSEIGGARAPVVVSNADDAAASTPPPRYGFLEASTPIDYPTIQFAIEQALRMIDIADSSILVFLPGWEDIRKARDVLERNTSFYVLPLHSAVSAESQLKCFLPPPPGKVKIILSTNIAESGVTIDDVGVVIDTGRMKQVAYATRMRTFLAKTDSRGYNSSRVQDAPAVASTSVVPEDAQGKFSHLMNIYASRANCVQRRGRVGRTRPGLCIRLFSREHFRNLHEFQTPELLRTPLDKVCLTILNLEVGSPQQFLKTAMEPPLETEVEGAMKRLYDLGATDEDGHLTPLGRRLAKLPLDPATGKTILLGAVFRCLDAALTIAATAENGVFSRSFDVRVSSRLHREDLSCNTLSDILASVNGYNYWVSLHRGGSIGQSAGLIKARHLSVPALMQATLLKQQYCNLLVEDGFIGKEAKVLPSTNHSRFGSDDMVFIESSEHSRNSMDVGLLKCLLSASALPKVAMVTGPFVLRTLFENYILMMNDSVLRMSGLNETSSPFVIYGGLMKMAEKETLMAHHLTSVSLWSVLLMSTRATRMDYDQELKLGIMSNWIFFRSSYATIELVRRFKALLDRRLSRKFDDPTDAVNNAQLDELCEILRELANMRYHPNRLQPPSVVWGEQGKILSPNSNADDDAAGVKSATGVESSTESDLAE